MEFFITLGVVVTVVVLVWLERRLNSNRSTDEPDSAPWIGYSGAGDSGTPHHGLGHSHHHGHHTGHDTGHHSSTNAPSDGGHFSGGFDGGGSGHDGGGDCCGGGDGGGH
jgi:hypothetical protein